MIPRVYLCSQVVLSNFLNKFDVELSFLNDLRFNLILDLDSLFRNLFKLQLSMLSIYIFEFVVYMHILHYIRKLWFHVVYQLFIRDCIIKKKKEWMNERKREWKKDPSIVSKVFSICFFNITNVMLLIMALQYIVCIGCNSRMLIQ